MSISSKEYTADFYDADYFERGKQSGKGWLENYRWVPRRTFREAFAFIDYLGLDDNSRVLDFGCSKGFMVRAMRELEITCEGCDISSYALSFAPDGCYNISDEYPSAFACLQYGKYSHIICKDVFEHLTEEQLTKTLIKLKTVAPIMMCVIPMGDNGKYRIPEYHLEISHLIAEDESWWINKFQECGWKIVKHTNHVQGLKDNWLYNEYGNHVFVLEVL